MGTVDTATTDAARAAVLARLWGAFAREPLPGLAGRHTGDGTLTCVLADGRELTGPEPASRPFARPTRLTLTLAGVPYRDPAALWSAVWSAVSGTGGPFAAELADSVANLALARAAQPPPDPARALSTLDGPALEQCVVDGHPLHPGCRTRLGMSTVEVRRYAPEHRPVVPLALVPVPLHRFAHTGAWPAWLRAGDHVLLPVHPWQAEHVLPGYPGLGRPVRTVPARPLMSLRTLATVDGAWHVKTAVDVQMTSAVRIVSPAAVRNGPAWSALIAELADKAGGLTVQREVAAGAVMVDGVPGRSLSAVLREPPRLPPGRVALPAAALAAPSPATGRPLVADAVDWAGGTPHAFLADLVRVLVPPLVTLLDLGVALEAHGQNVLIVLHSGRPERLVYRDLGGIRVSPARLRAHGVEPPPVHGDLANDDPAALRRKLLAGALSTVVSEWVATLAVTYGIEPVALWRTVAGALRGAAHPLSPGAAGQVRSLFSGPWPLKATTAMRLAADPLEDLWIDLPNPLEETE